MENVRKEKSIENSRDKQIARTSLLGIVVNVLMAGIKVFIGMLASSIAIISEGINNLTDVMTSVLTLLGTKLAQKHPDEKHPFGYGRIEYLTSLVVSILILFTGIELLITSVKLIITPEEIGVNYISLAIVAVSAVIKYFLGVYTVKVGRETGSGALVGVGLESKSDSFASIITIASAVAFIFFNISLDAYAGLITSAIIIRSGCEVLFSTISELIGRPGEKELASKLYKKIRATDGIISAVDMMLHNYGPDEWSGSVNIEVDHKKTVGEIYKVIHDLQLRIMHEDHVTMVFGIYAVDNDNTEVAELRKTIASFVRKTEHVKSYHAVYIEPGTEDIYCDFIVDYQEEDWDALRENFLQYMSEFYPGRNIILTIETEFV